MLVSLEVPPILFKSTDTDANLEFY